MKYEITMENFYMTLPSNVESKYFQNTISNYRTELAKSIYLNNEWEVGLSSISFTNSWQTLPNSEIIKFHFYNDRIEEIKVFKNHYATINSLITAINSKIAKLLVELRKSDTSYNLSTIAHDTVTEYNYWKLEDTKKFLVFPEMSRRLCKLLGFDYNKLIDLRIKTFNTYREEIAKNPLYDPKHENVDKIILGVHRYELFGECHSMFVFCDIVKSSFYGEKYSPLLRFVEIPTTAHYGAQVVSTYPVCHYIPVSTREFNSIQITIKDENDNLFPFMHGRVIIVLHFRQRQ